MKTEELRDFACRLILFSYDYEEFGIEEMNNMGLEKDRLFNEFKKLFEVE